MASGSTSVDGVSEETVEFIKARILEKEEELLDYQRPPKIRPDLKEIIEQEITEENLER